ncbi:WD40-repeat-containing domain protein [Xylariaceae sp. FL1019]|nr:WD40-repeat-containing domain protein [Xylariaceae sp. FL1019]
MLETSSEARKDSVEAGDKSAGEVSDSLHKLLKNLHVDDPWSTMPSAVDDRTTQAVFTSLLSRAEYTDICNWGQKDKTLLWIRGAAGEGKTMLMRSVARSMPMSTHSKLIPECHSFFFFNFSNCNTNHAAAALRHLIRGVIEHQPSLADHLDSKNSMRDKPTFDDHSDFFALAGALHDMIRNPEFPKTYFVVDGLDECNSEVGRPGLQDLMAFVRVSMQSSEHARWIVSSDSSCGEINLELADKPFCTTIDMSSLDFGDAVSDYVRSKATRFAEAEGYDEDLKHITVEALCERSPKNCLQVDLICEALKSEEKCNVERVLHEVKPLDDLNHLFDYFRSTLKQLPRDDEEFCLRILSSLTVVKRSLTLSEIKDFVCPEPSVDLRSILRKCSCFLHFGHGDVISFHHQSIRDYVKKQVQPFVKYHDTRNLIPTVDTCSSLVTIGLSSLVKSLDGDDHADSKPTASLILGWVDFLRRMIEEFPKEQSRDVSTWNIIRRTIETVVVFLREYFLAWFEVLKAENVLERACILLRNAILLIDEKFSTLIHETVDIREAQSIIHFHLSTETSTQVPVTNTMLFWPGGEQLKKKQYEDQTCQTRILHSGLLWNHDFGLLKGHNGHWVRSVAFSPDGRLIASGSDDASVRIWDTETGTTQHRLAIGSDWIYCVAFSSRNYIAAGSDEGTVVVWDSVLGHELFRQETYRGDRVQALAFSPDGGYLAGVSRAQLLLWNLDSKVETFRNITRDNTIFLSVSFSPDGKLFAASTKQHEILIWDSWRDPMSKRPPLVLSAHTGEVNSLAFSPDTDPCYLASGSHDGTIKIWVFDAEKPQCVQTLHANGPVKSVSFSNGSKLAAATTSSSIIIWDVERETYQPEKFTRLYKVKTIGHINLGAKSLAFAPNGTYIASTSQDNHVHLWYADGHSNQSPYAELADINGPVAVLDIDPNRNLIAAGHEDGNVTLWDMNDANHRQTQLVKMTFERRVLCLAFSPDGGKLATGSIDGTLCIHDLTFRRSPAYFLDHRGSVRSVAWSPEGRYLASVSDDHHVCIYRVDGGDQTWKMIQALSHSSETSEKPSKEARAKAKGYGRAVAFSPNERRLFLAAGGDDGWIVVWKENKDEWSPQYPIRRHGSHVSSIVFSPTGSEVLSAAVNRTLRTWNVETMDLICEIRTPTVLTSMRFEHGFENSNYVMTPTGAHPLQYPMQSEPDWCPYRYVVKGSEQYITRHGKAIIFVPSSFSSTCEYIKGNNVIMGLTTGQLMVFNLEQEEQETTCTLCGKTRAQA